MIANIQNPYRFVSGGGGFLLDVYSGGFLGFSLRKLKSSSTYSIRIKRLSDNAETDVGFDGSDTLSSSSPVSAGGDFGTWTSGSVTKVVTWYNQGSGNDLTEASLPPEITSAGGALRVKDGFPAVLFSNNQRLEGLVHSEFDNGNSFMTAGIASNETTNDIGFIVGTIPGTSTKFAMYKDNRTQKRLGEVQGSFANLTSQDSSTNKKLLSVIVDSSAADISGWADGVAQDQNVSFSGTYVNTTTLMGYNSNSVVRLNGFVLELIGFDTTQAANRAAIETEMNDYYSVY